MVDDRADEPAEYWRARTRALEDEIDFLKRFAGALAGALPPGEAAAIVQGLSRGVEVLPSGGDVTAPLPSDVQTELERLWESLEAPRHDR